MIKSWKIFALIVIKFCFVFLIFQNQNPVVNRASQNLNKSISEYSLKKNLFKNANNNNKIVNKKPRVLCLVTTTPKNHKTKALAVKETWGQRCDILLFLSSQKELPQEGLPIIDVKCEKEDYDHLWCKNRKGIVEAHKRFAGQYDWFYKADDDTYVIMENLKHLVGSHDPKEPVWFGCPLIYPDFTKYFSGGAGYIMSHEAVVRLIESFRISRKNCNTTSQKGREDVFLGRCFEKTGVKFGDERDELGRPRFFPLSPKSWLNPRSDVYKSSVWLKDQGIHHYKMGTDCCSDTSIAFHYISPEDMYVYDFFLYHMKVHK